MTFGADDGSGGMTTRIVEKELGRPENLNRPLVQNGMAGRDLQVSSVIDGAE